MPTDGLSRLTERERQYFRLVHGGFSTKEIALQFGIEPGTVDKAIEVAKAKLGTSSRRVAARMVVEADAPQRLSPQPKGLVEPSPSIMMALSDADRARTPSHAGGTLREEQAPYGRIFLKGVRLPIRRTGGQGNDLGRWQVVGWIAVIAAGIPVLLGSLMVGLWALGQVASALKRALS